MSHTAGRQRPVRLVDAVVLEIADLVQPIRCGIEHARRKHGQRHVQVGEADVRGPEADERSGENADHRRNQGEGPGKTPIELERLHSPLFCGFVRCVTSKKQLKVLRPKNAHHECIIPA